MFCLLIMFCPPKWSRKDLRNNNLIEQSLASSGCIVIVYMYTRVKIFKNKGAFRIIY